MASAPLPEKWAAARVWAAHQAPYLAGALLALEPVVVTDPSADLRRFPADTGWRVHLSVMELERQSVAEVGFWLVHQVTHLLREHARRYPGGGSRADSSRWNLAADAEINDDLGLTPPPGAITPALLALPNGHTAERYWHDLDRRTTEQASGERAEERDLGERDLGERVAEQELGGWDAGRGLGEFGGEGGLGGGVVEGDCGSGCDGVARVWDLGRPGLSGVGARLTALDVARRIRERMRARDDVPAGWLRWAEQVLEPAVDWRRLLAAKIRHGLAHTAGRVDYTYRRPSRRALPGVVLPSLHRPLPAVSVVIDTSGSVTDGMLGQALAEVTGVLRAAGRLTVISCDARAYRAQDVKRVAELRLGGGGGTDLREGFAAARARRPPPDLIIVITDGHTPWPDRPDARTRVIVCLLDAAAEPPGWAETVRVDVDVDQSSGAS